MFCMTHHYVPCLHLQQSTKYKKRKRGAKGSGSKSSGGLSGKRSKKVLMSAHLILVYYLNFPATKTSKSLLDSVFSLAYMAHQRQMQFPTKNLSSTTYQLAYLVMWHSLPLFLVPCIGIECGTNSGKLTLGRQQP